MDLYDTIALLVGRVILAWGLLDQRVHDMAATLQLGLRERLMAPENRFKHRMKLIRRLFVELTNNDSALLAEFDGIQTTIKELERKRAHLAHGSVSVDFDDKGVAIHDLREMRAFHDSLEEIFSRHKNAEERRALWAKHHRIEYSLAELDSLARAVHQINGRLGELHLRVRQRSRELGISTPLPN